MKVLIVIFIIYVVWSMSIPQHKCIYNICDGYHLDTIKDTFLTKNKYK
jgi:hypothetical protein